MPRWDELPDDKGILLVQNILMSILVDERKANNKLPADGFTKKLPADFSIANAYKSLYSKQLLTIHHPINPCPAPSATRPKLDTPWSFSATTTTVINKKKRSIPIFGSRRCWRGYQPWPRKHTQKSNFKAKQHTKKNNNVANHSAKKKQWG